MAAAPWLSLPFNTVISLFVTTAVLRAHNECVPQDDNYPNSLGNDRTAWAVQFANVAMEFLSHVQQYMTTPGGLDCLSACTSCVASQASNSESTPSTCQASSWLTLLPMKSTAPIIYRLLAIRYSAKPWANNLMLSLVGC
jgi:hypothetical protein